MGRITAIECGQLIDGTGRDAVNNAVVIIEDEKIKKVGTAADIPADAEIVDATGRTVMPGLIDAHMHYQGDGRGIFRPFPHELRLLRMVNEAKKMLGLGFTTTRDCGSRNGIVLRDAAKEGTITAVPRILSAGYIVTPTNNGIDDPYSPQNVIDARTNPYSGEFFICDGVGEARRGARMAIRTGADFVKIFNSGHAAFAHCSNTVTFFCDDEIRTIVDVAAKAGLKVSAHCMCDTAIRQCIECGVKIIDHACGITEETAKLGVEKKVVFTSVMTFTASDHLIPADFVKETAESYRIVREAGAVLATGSDLNATCIFPFGENAREMEMLTVHSGFSPMEAIVAGTKNGAIVCGIEGTTGTVEAGKSADIIVVDGDPLEDISILYKTESIRKVFLKGKLEVNRD